MEQVPGIWPHSIRSINDLPEAQKHAIYRTLIPDWVYPRFGINPENWTIDGKQAIKLRCPANSRAMELAIYSDPDAIDPSMYLNMADNLMGRLMVLLVVMNDLDSERYDIDVMPDGTVTKLGTVQRNIPEEIRAMEAGLAPGQVRRGLRGFRNSVPFFDRFVERMHHDMYLIQPLSYHNAIVFERYGFGYTIGRLTMERIHQAFQPGGELYAALDGSTPFRQSDAWRTVRGRAWAIHDGILGEPFDGLQLHKRIHHHAGINTFPDAIW